MERNENMDANISDFLQGRIEDATLTAIVAEKLYKQGYVDCVKLLSSLGGLA